MLTYLPGFIQFFILDNGFSDVNNRTRVHFNNAVEIIANVMRSFIERHHLRSNSAIPTMIDTFANNATVSYLKKGEVELFDLLIKRIKTYFPHNHAIVRPLLRDARQIRNKGRHNVKMCAVEVQAAAVCFSQLAFALGFQDAERKLLLMSSVNPNQF